MNAPSRFFGLDNAAHPAAHRVAAGLMAGALLCGCSLAAPTTPAAPGALAPSPAFAQTKTTPLTKSGMVTISAAEYCDRVNDAFDVIGAKEYKASLTKGTDGTTLDMDIRKGTKLVGYVEFCLSEKDKSWITYRERNSDKTFNDMLLTVFDDDDSAEYFVYTTIAMAMAIDPSLDKWDAQEIASYLADNAELQNDGKYFSSGKQNGIRYSFMLSDGVFFLLVDCSKA